jgi:hypothetical protein
MTYWYTPRGGYGFSYPVNAEVVKVNTKTARVRLQRRSGEVVERNVCLSKLTTRAEQGRAS